MIDCRGPAQQPDPVSASQAAHLLAPPAPVIACEAGLLSAKLEQRKTSREQTSGGLPRLEAAAAKSRADHLDKLYLRAAQAYMLISMPTGTSTIFGVFQVIGVSI
jgi:hypothetical protein